MPCCWCALTVQPLPRVKKLGLTWQFSENNICQEWWINNNIFGLAVTMSWISWIIAADCYNLGSLALHTPSSVIMDQSVDGSVVSLLDCVLLSWIKAWNSLWFYFWSHDTAFIYTAPPTYPTINNGNVKNKMKCLKYHLLVSILSNALMLWCCTGLMFTKKYL